MMMMVGCYPLQRIDPRDLRSRASCDPSLADHCQARFAGRLQCARSCLKAPARLPEGRRRHPHRRWPPEERSQSPLGLRRSVTWGGSRLLKIMSGFLKSIEMQKSQHCRCRCEILEQSYIFDYDFRRRAFSRFLIVFEKPICKSVTRGCVPTRFTLCPPVDGYVAPGGTV